jgi:hypothetical protein
MGTCTDSDATAEGYCASSTCRPWSPPGAVASQRAFYERKRAEGKSHKQAIIALARRCLNVIWALIRDGRTFEITAPSLPTAPG